MTWYYTIKRLCFALQQVQLSAYLPSTALPCCDAAWSPWSTHRGTLTPESSSHQNSEPSKLLLCHWTRLECLAIAQYRLKSTALGILAWWILMQTLTQSTPPEQFVTTSSTLTFTAFPILFSHDRSLSHAIESAQCSHTSYKNMNCQVLESNCLNCDLYL